MKRMMLAMLLAAGPIAVPVAAQTAQGQATQSGVAQSGAGQTGTGQAGAGQAAAAQVSATPALPGIPKPKPVSAPGEVSRNAPINGVLTLFGNERCPTNSNGDEIVVCVRRGAAEQYRVPKELREFQITPQNESWAAHAQGVLDTGVGVSSFGSCSAVGAAGATGCFAQQARQAKRESNAAKADAAAIP